MNRRQPDTTRRQLTITLRDLMFAMRDSEQPLREQGEPHFVHGRTLDGAIESHLVVWNEYGGHWEAYKPPRRPFKVGM